LRGALGVPSALSRWAVRVNLTDHDDRRQSGERNDPGAEEEQEVGGEGHGSGQRRLKEPNGSTTLAGSSEERKSERERWLPGETKRQRPVIDGAEKTKKPGGNPSTRRTLLISRGAMERVLHTGPEKPTGHSGWEESKRGERRSSMSKESSGGERSAGGGTSSYNDRKNTHKGGTSRPG